MASRRPVSRARRKPSAGIADRLLHVARQRAAAPAIEETGGGLTYAELAHRVSALADGLRKALAPGTRILIAVDNSAAFPVWVMGSTAAGMTPIVCDPRALGPDISDALTTFAPEVVVAEPDDPRFSLRLAGIEDPRLAVYAYQPERVARSQVARQLYAVVATSGSTGRPKGVVLSSAAWLVSAERLARVLDLDASDRALHVSSLAHGSGLLFAAVLLQGGTNIVMPRVTAPTFGDIASSLEATVTFVVPTVLYDLLREPWFHPDRLPELRTVYYSAGPASASLVRKAAQTFGGRLVQDYGLIEAPAPHLVLTRSDHEQIASDPECAFAASCGRPLHPAELTIRPSENDRRVGEICLTGPTLMSGYLTGRGVDRSQVRDGVLRTGDLAYRDDTGYVTLVGRTANVVATGGRKVSVELVEHVLRDCPQVVDAGVLGLDDARWGERLVAIVVPANQDVGREFIDDYLRHRLAAHERPKDILFADTLPVGASGKLRRGELRDLAAELMRRGTAARAD